MDRSGYTPEHDDELETGQPADDTSLAGRGWEILVGGEENAAELGGDDPFDLDPLDAATEDTLRMGMESQSSEAFLEMTGDLPPRDLSPEELGAETAAPAADGTAPGSLPEPAAPEEEAEPQPESEPAAAGPFERTGETPFGAPAAEPEPVMAVGEAVVVAPQGLLDAQPHDPFAEDEPAPPVDEPDELAPDAELGARLITQGRIDALWDEINETYSIVVSDVRGHYRSTDMAIKDLKRARELLVAGTEHFDNAEELVNRVKSRLRLEEKVRQWSRTHGTWIAIYLVTWLLLLFIGSLLVQRIDQVLSAFVPGWMADTFLPGMYGGLGGVIGALWVLINHIAKKRDFDPIHTPWYVTNPFMGIALGVVTYFVLRATSLTFNPNVVPVADGSNRLGLYLACIVVGFNQNVLWALIDRVIEAIIPSQETMATVDEAAASE